MLSPQLEPSQFSTSNVWFSFHAAQIHQFWFCNYPLHLTETERREHRVTEVKSSSRGKGGKMTPVRLWSIPVCPWIFTAFLYPRFFPIPISSEPSIHHKAQRQDQFRKVLGEKMWVTISEVWIYSGDRRPRGWGIRCTEDIISKCNTLELRERDKGGQDMEGIETVNNVRSRLVDGV